MNETDEDTRADVEIMTEEMMTSGYKVEPQANGGYCVEVYYSGRGTLRAAFTSFGDMVRWVADNTNEELPK